MTTLSSALPSKIVPLLLGPHIWEESFIPSEARVVPLAASPRPKAKRRQPPNASSEARHAKLGEITVRNHFRRGRQNIRAGQEEANCRPIAYEEREKLWRDAVKREKASRKKGCQNGELGKAGLAVLHSLLFDFLNMKRPASAFRPSGRFRIGYSPGSAAPLCPRPFGGRCRGSAWPAAQ